MLFCYFDKYPTSPNQPVVTGAKTVTQVMRDNFQGKKDEFKELADYKYDALLHLKMYVLADKFSMPKLQSYAQAKVLYALKYESSGFYPCVGLLDEMPEHVAIEAEKVLVQSKIGQPVDTSGGRFRRLEEERPEMAQGIRKVARVSR